MNLTLTLTLTLNFLLLFIVFDNKIRVFVMIFMALSYLRLIYRLFFIREGNAS